MNRLKFVASIATPLAVGFIGAFATEPAIESWYATLEKPALTPPNWVFSPVWTALYILMGVALFLVWRYGCRRSDVRLAVLVFALQLTLNGVWSVVFFGLKSPEWGLVNIVALIGALIWTMVLFYPISRTATYLLAPYLAWIAFATYLNAAIVILN